MVGRRSYHHSTRKEHYKKHNATYCPESSEVVWASPSHNIRRGMTHRPGSEANNEIMQTLLWDAEAEPSLMCVILV